jgi:hypothetical protein
MMASMIKRSFREYTTFKVNGVILVLNKHENETFKGEENRKNI